jgi:hypothetical protein
MKLIGYKKDKKEKFVQVTYLFGWYGHFISIINYELQLKLSGEERISKLKTFNYQFKLNQNTSRRKRYIE